MSDVRASNPVRRTRLRGVLVLAGTFLFGMLAGLGIAPLLRPPPGDLPPGLEALHLRPSQRARIQAILKSHAPEVDAALGDALPRLRAVQERVAVEIEGELDPSQAEAFRRDRADRSLPVPR